MPQDLPPADIEFSVIIPAFNEEGSLPLLQAELDSVMEGLSSGYEIIYVDDGSTDGTAGVLNNLKTSYSRVKVISFEKNRGKGAALLSGFRASRGRWIITLDGDLQNPPEEIAKLLPFRDKFDFIGGIREKRKDNAAKKAASFIARASRRVILRDFARDAGCGLRLFKRESVFSLPEISTIRNFFFFLPFLMKEKGMPVKEVRIAHRRRKFGKSKFGYLKRAINGISDLLTVLRLKNRIRR